MKKTIVLVVLLVIILSGGIVLISRQRSAPGPAMQKAQTFQMDSFKLDNLPLGSVIEILNSLVAKGHGGVELSLAPTAGEKEQTLISVNLQHASLAEVIGHIAEAAGLDVTEKDNKIILVPKKAP